MLEIAPLAPVYPILKPRAIKPDKELAKPPKSKKKQALEEPQPLPVPHIDELV